MRNGPLVVVFVLVFWLLCQELQEKRHESVARFEQVPLAVVLRWINAGLSVLHVFQLDLNIGHGGPELYSLQIANSVIFRADISVSSPQILYIFII